MKKLILIGGAMGAGKTTVCQKLKPLLAPSAFLDGDWCWDMEPFRVTGAAKAMVMDNIAAVLSNLLRCPDFESVLFCWVLPEREIAEALLARLPLEGVRVHRFTLTLTEEALVARLRGDIARGLRGEDIIPSALDRLKRCSAAGGELLDTTRLSPDEVAAEIAARVKAARKETRTHEVYSFQGQNQRMDAVPGLREGRALQFAEPEDLQHLAPTACLRCRRPAGDLGAADSPSRSPQPAKSHPRLSRWDIDDCYMASPLPLFPGV